MDYNKSKDSNEDDLVEHLKRLGFSVVRLYYVGGGIPDLIVGGDMPCPYCDGEFWQERLIEVKQDKRGLRPNQAKWWKKWRPNGEATIARSREDINRIVGRPAAPIIWIDESRHEDADQTGGAPGNRQDKDNPNPGAARRVSQKHRPSSLSHSGNPGED